MSSGQNLLTSTDALKQIVSELQDLQRWFERQKSWKQNISHGLSLSSMLPWPYVILSLIAVAALACSKLLSAWFTSLLILVLLGLSFALVLWDNIKKHSEISSRIQWCVKTVKDVYTDSPYSDCLRLEEFMHQLNNCNTASIRNSLSHSISYVYRKNHENYDHALPMPTSLLATGDEIALWTGQESPARVECAKDQCCTISTGEVFDYSHVKDCGGNRGYRTENVEYRFKVMESPITEEIKKCFKSFLPSTGLDSPPTLLFDRQRNFLLKWFLCFIIPGVLVITCVLSTIRFILLPHEIENEALDSNDGSNFTHPIVVVDPSDPLWYTSFVKIPVLMYVPFLPIILPMLLIMLTAIGEAKTVSVTYGNKIELLDRMVATPTTLSSQAIFFKNEKSRRVPWWKLLSTVLWKNDGTILPRNAGLFASLGSLTVLCCVDKEGILSWFNPATEKVFFFQHETPDTSSQTIPEEEDAQNSSDIIPLIDEDNNSDNPLNTNSSIEKSSSTNEGEYPSSGEKRLTTETLTLSQDLRNPYQIQFDDVRWEEHLASLKPLGLNIFLNLCTCSSDPHISQWTDCDSGSSFQTELLDKLNQKELREFQHTSPTHSIINEQHLASIAFNAHCVTPNTNTARMGLCSLTELIGFTQDGLRLAYSTKQSFTAYRKPLFSLLHYQQGNSLRKMDSPHDQLFETESLKRSKGRQCLPHLHGTLVQNLLGDEQVLVYGSGDLVAEQCHEVWDGREIMTMSSLDRKKVVDFYQRSSMAGQCVAFAFMPLVPCSHDLDDSDTSIPEENEHLMVNLTKDKERKMLKVGSHDTEVLNNLIFLGMTTLQYNARFSVCQMVDTLDRACIRFVYFSTDNEVRSRVFAEKMGLETGWNCHISLSSSPDNSFSQDGRHQRNRNKSESTKSRTSSECGPHKMKTSFDEDDTEEKGPSDQLLERLSPRTQSESSNSDSLFNMSNRAKLPRGIENIVPHIENVDNVPLLVPLFTDATPETAGQMIRIMQDYGEVVCCIGSSDCIRNMLVFTRANVSVALEPLVHPKKCTSPTSQHSTRKDSSLDTPDSTNHSMQNQVISNEIALTTARNLHVFPCSLLLSGDDGLHYITTMIKQARHFLFLLRVSFIFLVKSQITVTLFQLLSYILLLPHPFTSTDVFWLSFVILPSLSLFPLGSPPDGDLMTWANQKTLPKDRPITDFMMRQSTKRFLVKFLPSICVLVTCYALALHSMCMDVQNSFQAEISMPEDNSTQNSTIPLVSTTFAPSGNYSHHFLHVQCYPYFLVTVSTNETSTVTFSLWEITNELSKQERAIQIVMSCFLVLYLCTISAGYVHRWKRLLNAPPYLNKLWCVAVPILLACHLLGCVVAYFAFDGGVQSNLETLFPRLEGLNKKDVLDFGPFQSVIWTILMVWPIPCLVFNEVWKLREIKMWNRGQKRARLDFGTKLGMNSPF